MNAAVILCARLSGLSGALLIAAAVLRRLTGQHYLGPMDVGTLLLAGTAATSIASLLYLVVLVDRKRD
jgi:hypothetical protein